MKITNIGEKAIAIGSLSLLPGDTADLPREFENNSVIRFFEERGFVRLYSEPQPAEDHKPEKREGLTKEEVIEAIKSMKRSELDALAVQVGVEVMPDDTVPTLREKLIAYYHQER